MTLQQAVMHGLLDAKRIWAGSRLKADTETVALWVRVLGEDTDPYAVQDAFDAYAAEGEFAPKPSNIKALLSKRPRTTGQQETLQGCNWCEKTPGSVAFAYLEQGTLVEVVAACDCPAGLRHTKTHIKASAYQAMLDRRYQNGEIEAWQSMPTMQQLSQLREHETFRLPAFMREKYAKAGLDPSKPHRLSLAELGLEGLRRAPTARELKQRRAGPWAPDRYPRKREAIMREQDPEGWERTYGEERNG